MNSLRIGKCLLWVSAVLAVSLLLSGAVYAIDGNINVNLGSHVYHHVYKPGDLVEMDGTAHNINQVDLTVQDE